MYTENLGTSCLLLFVVVVVVVVVPNDFLAGICCKNCKDWSLTVMCFVRLVVDTVYVCVCVVIMILTFL